MIELCTKKGNSLILCGRTDGVSSLGLWGWFSIRSCNNVIHYISILKVKNQMGVDTGKIG